LCPGEDLTDTKSNYMKKLMLILFLFGIAFLGVFWVINPLMGAPLSVVAAPFIILSVLAHILLKKKEKQLVETKKIFQSEKLEIEKEKNKKERRQQEQFAYLQSFGRDLSTALNKDQLLRLIVSTFSKMTHSLSGDSQCFLLSHEPGSEEFVYEVGDNFDSNTLKSLRFNRNDPLMKTVVSTKKIQIFISDIFGGDSNIRYFLKEERVNYLSQLGSLALIPLILEDEVWGIIVMFCGESAATRIKNEEDFFLLLIAQASIALGSAIHRGLASVDRLTQLYNRTFLQKRCIEEIEFCDRQLLPMSLMMIDIDHFKEINDTYGHKEGDMVLKKVAQILSKGVRLTDLCARYGGEEFVVVLPGIAESPSDKFSIAERLRQSVERSDFVVLQDKHLALTISIGVTIRRYPEDKDTDMDELIVRADKLLYKAKNEGRNKVCYDAL